MTRTRCPRAGARSLACSLLLCGALLAAPASAEVRALRWREVVSLARSHPLVGEARLQAAAAEGELVAAGAVPTPSLEARLGRGSQLEESEPGVRLEWGLSLSLPLDWLALRGPQQRAARAALEAAGHAVRGVQLEVLRRLAGLFWSLAHDEAAVRSLGESEAQAVRLAALVRRRVERGEARPTELPRVETEVEKVRIELGKAEAQRRGRRAQLRAWLGLEEEVTVYADLASPPPLPAQAAVLARLRQHPAVLGGRARVRALEAEARVERWRRFPSLGVSLGYEEEVDRRTFGGALTVGLPLWGWNRGRIAQADARRAAEERRLEANARESRGAALEAYHVCEQARRTASAYGRRILPLAERAASSLERSFRLGESSLLEVLDTRRVVLEARREAVQVQLQQQLDCAQLRSLTGELADD